MGGYVDPNFELESKYERRQIIMPWGNYSGESIDSHQNSSLGYRDFTVHNGRLLQTDDVDKAEFFKEHGFVLLNKKTMVKEWNTDHAKADTDITSHYHGEVDEMIRTQLYKEDANIKKIQQANAVLRRGKNSDINFYALGIHQDYGNCPKDYQGAIGCYSGPEKEEEEKNRFEDEAVSGLAVICFWRPINMEAPLLHNPLAVCDASSVELKDCVRTEVYGYTPLEHGPKPQPQLFPKLNEKHKWYYYPDMTNDEILVFKQFEYHKSDTPETPYRCCFHSAVSDPRAGWFPEKRQSTEHRVSVYFD